MKSQITSENKIGLLENFNKYPLFLLKYLNKISIVSI